MMSPFKTFLGYHMQLLQILPISNSGGPLQPQVAKKKKKKWLLITIGKQGLMW